MRSIRTRKRCRRAPAASRRLFIRPSGRGCLRLSLRSFELSAPAASAASGQQVRRCTASGSGGGASGKGARPVRAVSSLSLLSSPFCLLLSACSRVVNAKAVSRRVVRESRAKVGKVVKPGESRKVVSLIAGSRVVRGQRLCVLLSKLFRRNVRTERLSRCNHNILLIFHAKVVFRSEDVNDGVYLAFCR